MPYYCHIDSSGAETNLQLYSLQQAATYWNHLVEELSDHGEQGVPQLKEKLTFILSCFGLSLSQLLGQNSPPNSNVRIADPVQLLNLILSVPDVGRLQRKRLKSAFADFVQVYDAVRHFGPNKEEAIYRRIDELAVKDVERFRRMTVQIWDMMIELYRKDENNSFDVFRSIEDDIVIFSELPNATADVGRDGPSLT